MPKQKSTPQEGLTPQQFIRLANNFYASQGLNSDYSQIATASHLLNYVLSNQDSVKKRYKIAFCSVVLNPPYWQYINDLIAGAKQFFLQGHDVDFLLWSDIPTTEEETAEMLIKLKQIDPNLDESSARNEISALSTNVKGQSTIFPTEGVEWPMPTLMRYHLYLQQEEKLKEYDYIFHVDVDMRFVNVVGDEILGEGLTAAQHPMYALRKEYIPPYEPNPESVAYIPRPGKVISDNGKPRFMPLYYAGGTQGGRTKEWISAMKQMRKMVDQDLNKNYIPIWNEESIWNRYLFDNPPAVVLTPSYVYPDSLIEEYYKKLWGCNYTPRIVTLTKPFSTNSEGGAAVREMISTM